MLPQVATVTRQFPLSESINIPRRIAEYKRGDRFLFVATTKASFVRTGPIGAEFMYMFEDGISLGVALSTLCRKHGAAKEAEIRSALSDLLTQIEARQFYQNAEVFEDAFSQTMLARLTNRCNLLCTHCLMSSSPDWPAHKELTTSEWCSIVGQYAEFVSKRGFSNYHTTFTGGEPLLRKDALEIAQHCKSLGIYTELFSNGALIANPRIAVAISSAVDEVQISVDGATAEVHDSIRGRGMFERSIRGLQLLRDANVKVRIAVVVMPQNFDDLMSGLPALVRRLGEGFLVKVSPAVEQGRATKGMLFASLAEAEEKVRALIGRLVSEAVRVRRPVIPNVMAKTCGYGREITISSDGLVYTCGPQKYPVGNLKSESFLSIAERISQKSMLADIDHVEGCRDCNIRYLCGGTCRLSNIARMGQAEVSCCDQSEKERKIQVLLGRASNIVPLYSLSNGSNRGRAHVEKQSSPNSLTGLVRISGIETQKSGSLMRIPSGELRQEFASTTVH
jgi:radical SAM protein with 4Fe4S-binding SPASM domain